MNHSGGNKAGKKEAESVSRSSVEKKGPRISVPEAQILFHQGEEGGEDNSGSKIEIEDCDQKKKDRRKKGRMIRALSHENREISYPYSLSGDREIPGSEWKEENQF
jgi:hypothetical protein